MKWRSHISTQNLKLAWRRVNTGRNLQYKRFFREAYLVYESGLDDHIRDLHKALTARVWQPTHATRIYLPKPSGLQRPLSLLGIEDQIVLQAIANKFASRLYKQRQRVELITVFSNKRAEPRDSIFFTERWQVAYSAFQARCRQAFEDGRRWTAHFDLSAYYDTISHDLLWSILRDRNDDPGTAAAVKAWLSVWSADNLEAMKGHGIPQGPVASDFLAEAFFLPIDIQMQGERFLYLRYVDDIRLFGRSENEVREAAIQLEQECRHRGLIPQSAKFDILEMTSPSEAMGSLPSIAPADAPDTSESAMTATKARQLLSAAIGGRPHRVKDKARFRYVMYRAPPDRETLAIALRLLPRHPEHIDAFTAHFSNYGKGVNIVRATIAYLESGVPYSYVRGELWQLLARLAAVDDMRRLIPMARIEARGRSRCVALSWGLMHFLMRCETAGLLRSGRRLATEHPISRALLGPIFPAREFHGAGQGTKLLKGTLLEQLAGARELQRRGIKLATLGLRQRDLPRPCKTALSSLGVVGRRHRSDDRDWVAELLIKLCGCDDRRIWRALLSAEYEHALQLLVEANARFAGAYSEWLGLQDSFCDIVVRSFLAFLRSRGLPGHAATIGKDGKLVDYGPLLAVGAPFDREYPQAAASFRALHERRNRLPGSHPYAKKGGARNTWLLKAERNVLLSEARTALNAVSEAYEVNV